MSPGLSFPSPDATRAPARRRTILYRKPSASATTRTLRPRTWTSRRRRLRTVSALSPGSEPLSAENALKSCLPSRIAADARTAARSSGLRIAQQKGRVKGSASPRWTWYE